MKVLGFESGKHQLLLLAIAGKHQLLLFAIAGMWLGSVVLEGLLMLRLMGEHGQEGRVFVV